MLQSFRDNLKGVAAGILVAVLAIPFALYGVDSLFLSDSAVEAAATVNGERITELRIQQAVTNERSRILSENEGLDPALLNDELIRPQVLQRLIGNKVIAQAASDQGMGVSSKTIAETLLSVEAFQTAGKFDQQLYQFTIRNQGYTSATFNQALKEDFLNQQFINGVVTSGFVTDLDLQNLASVTEQKRDYYYLTLPVQPIYDAIDLSDEEISVYYDQNKPGYQTEEQMVVEYIELSADILSAQVVVTDEQVKTRFDEEIASSEQGTSRRAAHILLSDPSEERLAELQGKLSQGEDFAELAKEYSEDFGSSAFGGDLGFSSGDTFPEAFEDALAELEINQVSEPVKTESGIHFIKLLEIQEQQFELASESQRIRDELRQGQAGALLVEKLEMLKELSFNAESLAEVAEDLELESQVSQPFSRAGGAGIASYPAVLNASFSPEVMEDNYASEVLDLGQDRYIVIKMKEHIPSRQKELSEVREQLVQILKQERAQAEIADRGVVLKQRIEAGASIEDVAKEAGLEWQVVLDAQRNSGNLSSEVRNAVFRLPAPSGEPVIEGFYTRNGDYVVVSLTEITEGKIDSLSEEQRASIEFSTLATNSRRELQAYQNHLLAGSDIDSK